MIISAFYSALRGGRMVADGLCDLVVEQGWQEYVEKLPGVAAPFDPDTTYAAASTWSTGSHLPAAAHYVALASHGRTLAAPLPSRSLPSHPKLTRSRTFALRLGSYLDEAILYPVAALGFSYQLLVGFTLPFPLNLLLLPLTIVEWILRWQITFTGSADVAGAGR